MQTLLFSPAPGVPLCQARVDGLATFYFTEPAPYPLDLIIAVPDVSYQPNLHLGAWQSVSPEEMKHALIRAIARGLSAGAEACVVERWRHAALSCTAEFKILTSDDDMCVEAFNARERVVADYASLSRTAYQRIFEIVIFRSRTIATLGTSIGVKALAQAFNEHARLSSTNEDVSGDYIAAALHAHDKALRLQLVTQATHANFENTPTASQLPSLPEAKLHTETA